MKRFDVWIGILLSATLIIASWQQWLPVPLTEALGFVTGAACVYLVVQQSIWNFPLGIANNIFFLVLFGQARLFGDAGLQIVYIVLGVHGWHQWLHGGEHRTALKVSRASLRLWVVLLGLLPVATWSLVILLRQVNGSAPVPDAFTTVLSLGAQYLLNRKLIENWWLWIVADVIYIYLYITRGLHLTAVLYFVFLCLCIAGLVRWRQTLRSEEAASIG
jgi:nicotinamide mononucleotide transporter